MTSVNFIVSGPSDVSQVTTSFNNGVAGAGHQPGTTDNCLLEQLRVNHNWKHLVNVEQGGQIKLNLREQLSARL